MQGEFLVIIGGRDIHNHVLDITNKKKHSQRHAKMIQIITVALVSNTVGSI